MSINVDQLMREGRENQKKVSPFHKLSQDFHSWMVAKQIATTRRKLVPIQEALKKIPGASDKIRIGEEGGFPVSIETGLTIEAPDYEWVGWKRDKYNFRFEDFAKKPTSPVIVKARGNKVILQGGNDICSSGWAYTESWNTCERVLAKGVKPIIRYLGTLTPSN